MAIISENISLKQYNTFSIDANTRYLATYASDYELIEILTFCKKRDLKWFVLGMGANVIFDGDYEGCVIHPIGFDIAFEGDLVIADGGVNWDDFVAFCVGIGYYGLENLSLIPSTVGAAPVQNIGAYGAEAKDCIEWVEFIDPFDLKTKRLNNGQCQFGYRDSIFKGELKGKAIITRVAFKLSKEGELKMEYGAVKERVAQLGEATLQNVRQAIIDIRTAKLPDYKLLPNAGSFFKNPIVDQKFADKMLETYPKMPFYEVAEGVKLAAGWLIEQSGWKGKVAGKVGINEHQALVIVNVGGANGREIVEFSDLVIADVGEKFGVTLEREVNIV